MVLVGPSGCGKTTALRMVAGLEDISEGVVRIGERVVNNVPPKDRDIAMVFQSYALYPHLSVYENIAFSLRLKHEKKDEIDRRVKEAAHILGLEPFLKRKPRALSGGQRQRVAMGRAIVREPLAFLMDEPLSNLDAKLRVQMRAEISRLQDDLGTTTIYVTHDQVEAMTMGDRIAVMRKGELQQVGLPQDLYDRPVNLFVGGFIGSPAMNMLEARLAVDDGSLAVELGDQRLALDAEALEAHPALRAYAGKDLILGLRPEHLEDAALVSRRARRSAAAGNRRADRGARLGDRRPHLDRREAGADRGRPRARRGHRRGDRERARSRGQGHARRPHRRTVEPAPRRDRRARRRHGRAPLLRSRDGSRDLRRRNGRKEPADEEASPSSPHTCAHGRLLCSGGRVRRRR